MSSLCVKFQPSSTPPTERFWWRVLLLLLLLVVVVTGVKQSQLLVLRLRLSLTKLQGFLVMAPEDFTLIYAPQEKIWICVYRSSCWAMVILCWTFMCFPIPDTVDHTQCKKSWLDLIGSSLIYLVELFDWVATRGLYSLDHPLLSVLV